MSLSGAHTAAFRRDVAQDGRVWTIKDANGCPAPQDADGTRAVPFWSKPTRAKRVIAQVEAFHDFDVVEIDAKAFLDDWLPGLERDGLLVGVNWAGAHATGYDITPAQVAGWFEEQP